MDLCISCSNVFPSQNFEVEDRTRSKFFFIITWIFIFLFQLRIKCVRIFERKFVCNTSSELGCWRILTINALSFYRSKMILDRPNFKLFCTGLNCFGQVQIILFRFILDFSGLFFIICTCPKWFGPYQNKLVPSLPSKTIRTQPK